MQETKGYSTLGQEMLAKLLFKKIKSLSNPERRTHVMAILLGSDGQYYYGLKLNDQCLVDLKDSCCKVKEMVVRRWQPYSKCL